jgi:hypothetical protein
MESKKEIFHIGNISTAEIDLWFGVDRPVCYRVVDTPQTTKKSFIKIESWVRISEIKLHTDACLIFFQCFQMITNITNMRIKYCRNFINLNFCRIFTVSNFYVSLRIIPSAIHRIYQKKFICDFRCCC